MSNMETKTECACSSYHKHDGPECPQSAIPRCLIRTRKEIHARAERDAIRCEELTPHAVLLSRLLGDGSDPQDYVSIGIGEMSVPGAHLVLHPKIAADVIPYIRAIREAGYRPWTRETYDYAELKRKTWGYWLPSEGRTEMPSQPDVLVMAFFAAPADATDACRWVQVGEEMKPIMKLVCPDGIDAEATVPS